MRYPSNKLCPDKQTNAADRQPEKHNAFANTVEWQRHIKKIDHRHQGPGLVHSVELYASDKLVYDPPMSARWTVIQWSPIGTLAIVSVCNAVITKPYCQCWQKFYKPLLVLRDHVDDLLNTLVRLAGGTNVNNRRTSEVRSSQSLHCWRHGSSKHNGLHTFVLQYNTYLTHTHATVHRSKLQHSDPLFESIRRCITRESIRQKIGRSIRPWGFYHSMLC